MKQQIIIVTRRGKMRHFLLIIFHYHWEKRNDIAHGTLCGNQRNFHCNDGLLDIVFACHHMSCLSLAVEERGCHPVLFLSCCLLFSFSWSWLLCYWPFYHLFPLLSALPSHLSHPRMLFWWQGNTTRIVLRRREDNERYHDNEMDEQ